MEHHIEIAGFRSHVEDVMELMGKINKISEKDASKTCIIQLLNADGIAGKEHILHATIHALHAFKRDENIANDLGLEICLRASAQRQISKALDILGLKEGEINVCTVLVGCKDDLIDELEIILGKRDDGVLEPNENLLKAIYNISDAEIETAGGISRVMIERTSLLILET